MANLDTKLTEDIRSWLETPEESRDIAAGAELLLKLNRNWAMYNSAVRRPAKYGKKIAYELRKFLKIRVHGMSVADVVDFEAKVMPRVAAVVSETLETAVISTDDERPQGTVARGRRADHDSLPDEIKELYELNGIAHRKIVLLYNELKAMSDAEPCDRFERLKLLDEAEREYRARWQRYDSFVEGETEEDDTIRKKKLSSARKSISKYRGVYASVADDSRRAAAVKKVAAAAAVVKECGGDFSDETLADLKEMGIEV